MWVPLTCSTGPQWRSFKVWVKFHAHGEHRNPMSDILCVFVCVCVCVCVCACVCEKCWFAHKHTHNFAHLTTHPEAYTFSWLNISCCRNTDESIWYLTHIFFQNMLQYCMCFFINHLHQIQTIKSLLLFCIIPKMIVMATTVLQYQQAFMSYLPV